MAQPIGKNLYDTLDPHGKDQLIAEAGEVMLFELREFTDFFDEQETGYKYLSGDQHLPDKREWFISNDRPVRAFNLMFPRMNTIVGDWLLNQQRRKVFPLPGGSPKIAGILQKVLDQLYSEQEIKSELVMTGIAGMIKAGYAFPRVSNEKEIDGSIVVGNVNEFEVLFDSRSRRPFLDDASYMIRFRRYDSDDLANTWSEHKTKLREILGIRNRHDEEMAWLERLNHRSQSLALHHQLYDQIEGKWTVIEYHKKQWMTMRVFTDILTGVSEIIPSDFPEDRLETYKKMHPIHTVTERTVQVKTVTEVVPGLNFLLGHYEAPLQDGTFDIMKFSFYPYGRKAIDDFGLFKNAKDPQDDFNEQRNKNTDILNKVANPGFTYRTDALENPEAVTNYSAKTGQNFAVLPTVADLDQAIKRNDFTNFPTALAQLVQEDGALINEVMGTPPNFSGQTQTKAENASLFAQRVQQSQQGLQIGHTQWANFNRKLDNKIIKLAQLYYTTERIVQVVSPFDETPENIVLNFRVGNMIINDITRGRFESVVDEQNRTPTMRLVQFQMKTELIGFLSQLFGPAVGSAIDWDWYLGDAIDMGDVQPLIDGLKNLVQGQVEASQEEEAFQRIDQIVGGAQQQIALQQAAASAVRPESPKGTNGVTGQNGKQLITANGR